MSQRPDRQHGAVADAPRPGEGEGRWEVAVAVAAPAGVRREAGNRVRIISHTYVQGDHSTRRLNFVDTDLGVQLLCQFYLICNCPVQTMETSKPESTKSSL